MSEFQELLWMLGLWGGVVVLGGLVSYYAIRAWGSSRDRPFVFLAGGFLALSVASAFTWFALYFAGQDLMVCEAGSTGFTLAGFGTIFYALRSRGT